VRECLTERQGVKAVNVFYNLPWIEISEKVPTKTGSQCRSHWLVDTYFFQVLIMPMLNDHKVEVMDH